MLDGVLVINEIADFDKRFKKECLLFKIDFEKACDNVSWSYLNSVMVLMSFRDK